jgi:RNA polymerase sigma-70 factor (ECF subfamily)
MDSGQFTTLLAKWSRGDKSALKALMPIVYAELHRLAAFNRAGERGDHTLQPTALLHEAYLKLVDHKQDEWHGRAHFFAVASHIMREILIDHARKHRAAKRGGGHPEVPLEDAIVFAPERSATILALDEALRELANNDARKAQIIELKYFGGLSGEEIAEVLNVSLSTVTRDSRMAEAWLQRYLAGAAAPDEKPQL